jgi:RNA polymerase sigma-70 factor (ECF subfamily)
MMALSPTSRSDESTTDSTDLANQEAELVRDAVAGSSSAFAQIVHQHHRRVYAYLNQMTRRHHDAEDLTQQTFIKAFHHLGGFDPRRPLINWLLTIARNTALNHFRDTKQWEAMPYDMEGKEPSPAHQAEHRDQATNLWDRARTLLSAREYEIMWLRFAEELSTEETARVVGLTTTHVKVLVHRARQTLLKGAQTS